MSALDDIHVKQMLTHIQNNLSVLLHTFVPMSAEAERNYLKQTCEAYMENVRKSGAVRAISDVRIDEIERIQLIDTHKGPKVLCYAKDDFVAETVKYRSRRYARKGMKKLIGNFYASWTVQPHTMHTYTITASKVNA